MKTEGKRFNLGAIFGTLNKSFIFLLNVSKFQYSFYKLEFTV